VKWRLDDIDGWLAHPECTEARSIAAAYMVKSFLEKN
jgi:hypothetical protein